MYTIIKDNQDKIQDSVDNVVIDPELKEKINGVSTLTYSIPFSDRFYDDYLEMKTTVTVYGENKSYPEFKGRLLDKKTTFNGNKLLTFEGELAYLNDIQYPPYSFSGSPEEFFENILNYYNANCSEDKRINKGIVTVRDANDYITRENQDYSSCWNVISEKLVNMLGGYIKLRYVNNERYLDYLIESGNVSNQTIEFGKNLLDLENYINAASIGTVIIPLGAKNEDGQRITIESVNDGKKYLENSLADEYGRIEKTVIWDDVTVPSNLKTKGSKYLEQMILADTTITVKAIDLHFTDEQIDSFKIGNIIKCVSKPHKLDTSMILVERNRKLNDPVKDTITLGTQYKKITGTISEVTNKADENESKITGNWLQNIIEENTKILLGGSGGYIYVHYADDAHKQPDSIYIMDCESTSEAKNVILINKNGIGYSTNGINGPFTSAWTIDGKFNADTIQAHTITVNHLASNVGEKLDLSSNESIKLMVKKIEEEIKDLDTSLFTYELLNDGTSITDDTNVVLSANVFNKGEDITDTLEDIAFNWIRQSKDTDDDQEWNDNHKALKNITLTADDVNVSAAFYCQITMGFGVQRTQSITITDQTDIAQLGNSFLDADTSLIQTLENDVYFPDWKTTPVIVTPSIIDGMINVDVDQCSISFKRMIDNTETDLTDGETVENNTLKISKNILSKSSPSVTYVCYVSYKNSSIKLFISFYLNIVAKDGNDGEKGGDGKDGTDGISVVNVISYFAVSNSDTVEPSSGWITSKPERSEGQWIWRKDVTRLSDGTEITTPAYVVTGDKGDTGATGPAGKGIKGTPVVTYQAGTSATTPPTGQWQSSVPAVSQGQYLWSKTVYTYTDNSTSTIYAVNRNPVDGVDGNDGADGTDGKDGKGIKTAVTTYQASSSGTVVPTGTWSSSIPSTNAGQYLWTRTITTYTDNSTSTAYSVGRNGTNGADAAVMSDTAPADKNKLWYDTANDLLKYWDGTAWIVVNDYADDMNNMKQQITTEYTSSINQLKESLTSLVEKLQTTTTENTTSINSLSSQIAQNATSITMATTSIQEITDKLTGMTTKEEISKWARYEDGILELGSSDSPFAVKLSQTELGFYQNGTRIAYLSNQQLNISQAVVMQQINIGTFQIIYDADYGLMFM